VKSWGCGNGGIPEAEGRFFVPTCRSTCKKETSAVLGQACPGSEQEGPARVARCPHERRSGARGRGACLPTGASLGGTQSRFLNTLRPAGVMILSAVCPMMSEPQPGVGKAGTAIFFNRAAHRNPRECRCARLQKESEGHAALTQRGSATAGTR
jgi:hypothetical protein